MDADVYSQGIGAGCGDEALDEGGGGRGLAEGEGLGGGGGNVVGCFGEEEGLFRDGKV